MRLQQHVHAHMTYVLLLPSTRHVLADYMENKSTMQTCIVTRYTQTLAQGAYMHCMDLSLIIVAKHLHYHHYKYGEYDVSIGFSLVCHYVSDASGQCTFPVLAILQGENDMHPQRKTFPAFGKEVGPELLLQVYQRYVIILTQHCTDRQPELVRFHLVSKTALVHQNHDPTS